MLMSTVISQTQQRTAISKASPLPSQPKPKKPGSAHGKASSIFVLHKKAYCFGHEVDVDL